MRTLFLQAPSFDGFDGGAGARYQAQARDQAPSGIRPGSRSRRPWSRARKLIDAPPHDSSFADVAARGEGLRPGRAAHLDAVLRLRREDRRGAEGGQSEPQDRPDRRQGRGRADEQPAGLRRRSISSPATNSTSPSRKSPTAATWATSRACPIATPTARSSTTRTARSCENMDALPFVTPVYKRDLEIENYFIGYLKHPYISFYTGRGCKSRCTFCLWPQTVGGHRYRTRCVGHVIEEIEMGEEGLPAGEGILLRRRHLHRQPAARRSASPRSSASSASPGRATPRPMCRARR